MNVTRSATRRPSRKGLVPALMVSALGLSLLGGAAPALAQEPAPAEETVAAWLFPKEIQVAGRRLALHEPVVLDHDQERRRVTLRVPIEVTDPLGKTTGGVADVSGSVHLDIASRLAMVDVMEVTSSAFPALSEKAVGEVQAALADAWPPSLLLRLELIVGRPTAAAAADSPGKLSSLPPKIHVRNQPAMLIQIDGEPVLEPVQNTPLQYILNTATDLFQDPSSGAWYMLLNGSWATSKTLEDGDWAWLEGKLPVVMSQLPISHPRGHIRQFVPGTREFRNRYGKTPPATPTTPVPDVIITKEPAELVLLEGDPLFTLVPGVKLMPVANTQSDLFFHPRLGNYFLLISGRWLTANELDGEWKPHFGKLPEQFLQIPRDHVRAHVVWCVPGTPEAAEAAALASLWEHAVIKPSGRVEILFQDGELRKLPIEGGEFSLVTSTEDDLLVSKGGKYYACIRGAWFASNTGKGDWKPIEALPEALGMLPAGGTPYHINFSRPIGAHEGGYAFKLNGGYEGVFVEKGSVKYGTGWSRPGMKRGANWYPTQRTYGENRWYDPGTGMFQPRSVTYGDDGRPAASAWSVYAGSYGRVRGYANRYYQGGRRMFPFRKDIGAFDTSAARTDTFGTWASEVAQREGLDEEAFPFGDRHAEQAHAGAAMVADAAGTLYRRTDSGSTEANGKDGTWASARTVADDIKALLDMFERLNARPAQWAAWRAERAAPVPINPSVTPMHGGGEDK